MGRLQFAYLWAIPFALLAAACGGNKPGAAPHDGGLTVDSGKDGGHPKVDAGKDAGTPPPPDSGAPGDDGSVTPTDDGGAPTDDGSVLPTDDGSVTPTDGGLIFGDATVDDSSVITPPPQPVGPGSPTCASAVAAVFTNNNSVVWTSMDAGTTSIAPPCAPDGGITSEVFFSVTFSRPVLFYADTFASSWNTLLYLLTSSCAPITAPTTTGATACNDDSCGTQQSQLTALLQPGEYILGVATIGAAAGTTNVHLQYAFAPSGTTSPLPQGTSVLTGNTAGTTGNINGQASGCIAAGPENAYWWNSCPNDPGGVLTASTCGGGTKWESVISTEVPEFTPVYSCTLDGCYPGTTLSRLLPAGPGLRVLVIDGETGGAGGPYTMDVSRP